MALWRLDSIGRRRLGAWLLAVAGCGWAPVALADYVVQVGVFSKPRHAGELARELHLAGLTVKVEAIIGVPDRLLLRLFVGPYEDLRQARQALRTVNEQGAEGFVRKYEPGPDIKPPPEPRQTAPPEPTPEPETEPEVERTRPVVPPPSEDEPVPPPEFEEEAMKQALSEQSAPVSAEELFGFGPGGGAAQGPQISGFLQTGVAYTTAEPRHWSKLRNTLQLSAQGSGYWGTRWQVSGRAWYDAVFDVETGFYPEAVENDRQLEAMVRETYLDIPAGDWEFRLGRQHIVWGEMVGLFFADVVSAKEFREFVAQDFDFIRTPQWAARAEYFHGDFHGELVWIPYPTFNDIGEPGDDFFPSPPLPPDTVALVKADDQPGFGLGNSNYGARVSYIQAGWDMSAFYYRSLDSQPAFEREVVPGSPTTFVFEREHEPIHQFGATLSKDYLHTVVQAELIYTKDRQYSVTRLSDDDGLVRGDQFDYVIGFDHLLPSNARLNVQFFERHFLDHDPDMLTDAVESGYSVMLRRDFSRWGVEPQLLILGSFNRDDWLIRPQVTWSLGAHWELQAGADWFEGEETGLFGQFDDADRVYTELRYTF